LSNEGDVTLISIGCGGGQKDSALLKALRSQRLSYVPTDVSLPLALTANRRASRELSIESKPALFDLPVTTDLAAFLDKMAPPDGKRILAFFGMVPNFEPDEALAPLSSALREGDWLLISANLAPGSDYEAGLRKVLPLYENDLTRRWLATALHDAGLEISPQHIEFSIVPGARGSSLAAGEPNRLLRIEANYRFKSAQTIQIDGEKFSYATGDSFRLFFSYRHTPKLLRELLAGYGMEITREWIAGSAEEGVFLAQKR